MVHGLGPLYLARADGSTLRLVRDALGSVRAELGDLGVVTKAFRYAAYGAITDRAPLDATPTLLGFTGELTDPSGLTYLRARWYDPAIGRFFSRDLLPGTTEIPTSLNTFTYVKANPTRYSDPLGLFAMGDSRALRLNAGAFAQTAADEDTTCVGATVECKYQVGDVTVVNNVGGLGGLILSLVNPGGAIVLNSREVWAAFVVSNPSDLMSHELGHIAQAQEWGWGYLPGYLKETAATAFGRWTLNAGEIHQYHPYEIDANRRAGLDPVFGN